jgi:hypothetical protein
VAIRLVIGAIVVVEKLRIDSEKSPKMKARIPI